MLTVTYGYKNFQTKTIAFYKTDLATTQTSIIQDALNFVSGHAGGFVKLSVGTFTVVGKGRTQDGALRIGSSTVLMGAGMAETTITLATGSAGVAGILRVDFGSRAAETSGAAQENARIECLTINGNASRTFGEADGFSYGAGAQSPCQNHNIWLDRVAITNVTRHGLDARHGNPNLTITNCVLGHNAKGTTLSYEKPGTVASDASTKKNQHQVTAPADAHAVFFQDTAKKSNCQTGMVVQTGDNWSTGLTAHVPDLGANVDARSPHNPQQTHRRVSSKSLEHGGMDTIRRRMPVSKGLDIDDYLFAHVDAPLEGSRTHMR